MQILIFINNWWHVLDFIKMSAKLLMIYSYFVHMIKFCGLDTNFGLFLFGYFFNFHINSFFKLKKKQTLWVSKTSFHRWSRYQNRKMYLIIPVKQLVSMLFVGCIKVLTNMRKTWLIPKWWKAFVIIQAWRNWSIIVWAN